MNLLQAEVIIEDIKPAKYGIQTQQGLIKHSLIFLKSKQRYKMREFLEEFFWGLLGGLV